MKMIFFDLGNVLAKGIEPAVYPRICPEINIETLMSVRYKHFIPYCLGKATEREFWQNMKLDLGLKHELDFLMSVPYEHVEVIEDNVNFAKELSKFHRIGIISNHTNEWSDAILDKARIRSYADPIIISSRVGVRKPDKRIYEIAIERSRVPPADCIFVDDKKKNIDTAIELGMIGVHLQRPEDLRRELSAYLI